MKIVLGSTSQQKLRALQTTCQALGIPAEISGIKTTSGENEQPIGFFETYGGALTRAQSVQQKHPDAVCIGIESGIFELPKNGKSIYLDIAVVVVLHGNKKITTTSTGLEFPNEYVEEANHRGFETITVGSVIAEKLGGDSTDPHALLTQGKVTRSETLTFALGTALRQL